MFKPRVSEHALFRYLERTGRIDRAELEAEILGLVNGAAAVGATSVTKEGFTFILDRGEVITVYPGPRRKAKKVPSNERYNRRSLA